VRVAGVTRRRAGEPIDAGGQTREPRTPLVAAECWRIGLVAAVIVAAGLFAAGAHARHNMYRISDGPFFLAVGRHPFASGQLPGNPLIYGVAYRYGRILFPLTGWLAALGRPSWVSSTLLGIYVASFGAWVAFAAEHLRRNGRRPGLALCILALPFALLAFVQPVLVSEPMAGALVLLAYLYEGDGRRRAVLVVAALLILTREPMALALLPLVWAGWKERRLLAVRDWALVCVPYVAWTVWVRVRVGQFPFLDPSTSRRDALAAPFVGWARVLRNGPSTSQQIGLAVALVTLLVAVAIALGGHWRYPVTHGALALCVLVPFLGVSVFRFSGEAVRVLAPIQALLLIAALDRGEPPELRTEVEPAERVRSGG
jgi:hypothetical protein